MSASNGNADLPPNSPPLSFMPPRTGSAAAPGVIGSRSGSVSGGSVSGSAPLGVIGQVRPGSGMSNASEPQQWNVQPPPPQQQQQQQREQALQSQQQQQAQMIHNANAQAAYRARQQQQQAAAAAAAHEAAQQALARERWAARVEREREELILQQQVR
jgi:hypothetical protein